MEIGNMFNKKLLTAAVTATVLAGTGVAQAQDPGTMTDEGATHGISANVTLASDYTFRGISQTDEKPAIQGGFDYEHPTGLYLGTWASNVNFGEGSNSSTEMDFYGGFAGESEGGLGYDVSYIYFDYKGDSNFDYQEFGFALSYVGATLGVYYSDEYLGNGGPEFWYPYAQYSTALFDDKISLDLHYGYSDASDGNKSIEFDGSNDTYSDWSVTFGYSAFGVDFAVAYVDTDLESDFDAGDARAVFSISKSM